MILIDKEKENKKAGNKLKDKLKEKFNQTDLARKLYSSEEFKNYEEVKTEMKQFKEDFKDHVHQTQNPILQGSLHLLVSLKINIDILLVNSIRIKSLVKLIQLSQ